MRLFVALDIDDSIRARLEKFLDGVRGFAPEARWVRPESMHVTLKFIGEKPAEIKQALKGIRAGAFEIAFPDTDFFLLPNRLAFSGLALQLAWNWQL
jgi:2'-5' RNA ligase